jgi:putative membrane-bound dehydrogenase-like protein
MRLLILFAGVAVANVAMSADVELNGHKFTIPEGFQIEQIAGQPLVDRPVSADFDEQGRLYVTDSSGSNEPVAVQQEKRPHRIMRLEDVDGDGTFDNSTVYADKLMFPEGSQWFDGSLYVAAPPEIWKFTDADDDGVAEQREVWFDGKTLTHCANDLHGPYLGPDGWMYWCKGAFAEQTYDQPGKSQLHTKAAHIFRRRPEGGPIEAVMTGGMDNPVEVIFTPGGERIFTTTFLVNPNQGLRDGLIHAVYGGVYGKEHAKLDGHPRTGNLMPVLSHLGAAAPCGLARLQSHGLGVDFQNNVLACSFNMHKITRHVLTKNGATFASQTSDLIVSDNLDFHPTDVLEDADGSIIVVDTGGWFKLCCPTSQLEKPDVLGGIYRIRRSDQKTAADPRGKQIDWKNLSDAELTGLLNDPRFAVQNQARQQIGRRGPGAVGALKRILDTSPDSAHRLQIVWALTWIDAPEARAATRFALLDNDETVRQAALHSISVHQDDLATDSLLAILKRGSPHNRRAAAEALGRVGSSRQVHSLLTAVPTAMIAGVHEDVVVDRFLEHSLIYAAMEIGAPEQLRKLIASDERRIRRAALIALDQLEGARHLVAADVQPLLVSADPLLNDTAWWIAEQHPDWGDAVVAAFRNELQQAPTDAKLLQRLTERLARFSASEAVQQAMAETLQEETAGESVQRAVMHAMADSGQKPLPAVWVEPLRDQLSGSSALIADALTALNRLKSGHATDAKTIQRLGNIANDEGQSAEFRLRSLKLLPVSTRDLSTSTVDFVCSQLAVDSAIANRAMAVDVLTSSPLNSRQLQQVARQLPRAGSMELQPLLTVFTKSKDKHVGTALVTALLESPAATSLFPDRLKAVLSGFGASVADSASPLLARIEAENQSKVERGERILALLPQADIRRGLKVFQGTKASCIACHRRGYLGGAIGPDLNRIGSVRTERDLLESILFPSLSFVRSYEPMSIVTTDGLTFNGLVRGESNTELTLQLDAQKSVQIPRSDIEESHMGKVSIMPAGLEKQLTPQELADLVKYLKEG